VLLEGSMQDQPLTVLTVPDFNTVWDPVLCLKDYPNLESVH